MSLDRAKINLILATAAFVISSAGSVLLHIALATTIYKETGSGALTSLFLSLQWLPVLAVIIWKSDWEDGVDPRKRWFRFDLLSALLTVPIIFIIDERNYVLLFILLFLRGVVDHSTRIIKTVSSRYIFPPDRSTHYASIMQTGYHFGIGAAAVIGILLGNQFSPTVVAWIDAATFVISAGLIALARTTEEVEAPVKAPNNSLRHRLMEYGAAVKSDRRLFLSVLIVPLSSAIFQGSYSVLQPIFPLVALKLSTGAVTISYVLSSMAILSGSSLFTVLSKRFDFFKGDYGRTKAIIVSLSVISALAYFTSVVSTDAILSAIFFTLMIAAFEMVYMFGYGGIVAFAPKGQLGSVFAISFCIGCSGGSLFAVFIGWLLDVSRNNFFFVTAVAMGIYFSILALGSVIYRSWKGQKSLVAA